LKVQAKKGIGLFPTGKSNPWLTWSNQYGRFEIALQQSYIRR
jgi:hypothetical protein